MKLIFGAAIAAATLLAGGLLLANQIVGDRGTSADGSAPHRSQAARATSGEAMIPELVTVSLEVSNMYCASCPVIVRRTLERVQGVRNVSVALRTKTATVDYDPHQAGPDALIAALSGMGYPAALVQ